MANIFRRTVLYRNEIMVLKLAPHGIIEWLTPLTPDPKVSGSRLNGTGHT